MQIFELSDDLGFGLRFFDAEPQTGAPDPVFPTVRGNMPNRRAEAALFDFRAVIARVVDQIEQLLSTLAMVWIADQCVMERLDFRPQAFEIGEDKGLDRVPDLVSQQG